MTSSSFYDVIVAGLGAMGAAAVYHLAKGNVKVLGLDQFAPPHTFGSSHGRTRIIREAYFEHPAYVPLVQRAYELWHELEVECGQTLFRQTGGLMIGPPDGIIVGGARRSAEEHHLDHEILGSTEIRRRFPALQPAEGHAAVWEPRAGALFPEACIQAHLERAQSLGAELHLQEAVRSWVADGQGVQVRTETGSYSAAKLILACGAWMKNLLPNLALPLQVERQVLFWFEPRRHPARFHPDHCPIFLWEFEPGRFFYGFPDLGDGVKVAGHHEGRVADPDALDRTVASAEVEHMRELLRRFLPDAEGSLRSTAVCMYTNTPDTHFIIDQHPAHPQVLIASPCSGHGFKFASAIGEVLSQLACSGTSRPDLQLFRMDRLSP